MNEWGALVNRAARFAPNRRQAVPVHVRRNAKTSVLWLNERWFASVGFDLRRSCTRSSIEDWLLRRFGVSTCKASLADDTLFAESYGATNGSIHGGGGRSAGRDGFHAKGIGRTPLAASNTDFHHSHGSLWLYEAVREVIASEVVHEELPYGAVPIIALMDTDVAVEVEGSGELAKQAIIVRPDFVRPAHFERSIFFGSSGHPGSDQVFDAGRVAEYVAEAESSTGRLAQVDFTLHGMITRIATQLGSARSLRLWQGQFSSANLTIQGAFTDFGAFCSLPDWRRSERWMGERFGDELDLLSRTARSVHHELQKYGRLEHRCPSRQDVQAISDLSFRRQLAHELGMGSADQPSDHRLLSTISDYFEAQQREKVLYEDGVRRPWIGRSLLKPDAFDQPRSVETTMLKALAEQATSASLTMLNAKRLFADRPSLSQGRADAAFKRFSNPSGYDFVHTADSVSEYIDKNIALSRRSWRLMPTGHAIRYQWYSGCYFLVQTVDVDGAFHWWIRGLASGKALLFKGLTIDIEEDPVVSAEGLLAVVRLNAGRVTLEDDYVSIDGARLPLAGNAIDWTDYAG